ncbi:hypothetical protein ZIOFF_024152 [Zingiber officinale]|uniref:Pentatricopeptide repeat-containing protein n=1 Tax=Zingiber officinale TaxID=94328 RepID=A0A8J5HBK9_ZINOF|nr:hypothetical protein ZIOFF_024152 [Zingiber officinale]
MKMTRGKAQSAKACPVSDATHRDPRCLSAIISGLALDGRPWEALRLFKWFQTSDLDPDEFTLSNALSLSANLSALDQGRQVSIEEGEGKAQELGVMFIKTSAKAGFNIKWFLDKASIFRRAAEDGFLNIWDYEG